MRPRRIEEHENKCCRQRSVDTTNRNLAHPGNRKRKPVSRYSIYNNLSFDRHKVPRCCCISPQAAPRGFSQASEPDMTDSEEGFAQSLHLIETYGQGETPAEFARNIRSKPSSRMILRVFGNIFSETKLSDRERSLH